MKAWLIALALPLPFLPGLSRSGVPATPAMKEFRIDPGHSTIFFGIKHLNVAKFYGRFNEIEGSIGYDESKPEASSVQVNVRAESVDTNNQKRDEHLRSPDFLNTKQFARISFESKKVKALKADKLEIEGDLTLHGVTKTVKATAERVGYGAGMKGEKRVGFEVRFTINRHDFDVSYMKGALGDEVDIVVSVEAIQKES